MYAMIAKPLYTLLVHFEWANECEEAFTKLKSALVFAPILKALVIGDDPVGKATRKNQVPKDAHPRKNHELFREVGL